MESGTLPVMIDDEADLRADRRRPEVVCTQLPRQPSQPAAPGSFQAGLEGAGGPQLTFELGGATAHGSERQMQSPSGVLLSPALR